MKTLRTLFRRRPLPSANSSAAEPGPPTPAEAIAGSRVMLDADASVGPDASVSPLPEQPVNAGEVPAATASVEANVAAEPLADEPAEARDGPDRDCSSEPVADEAAAIPDAKADDPADFGRDAAVVAAAAQTQPTEVQGDLLAALAATDEVVTIPDVEPAPSNPLKVWATAITGLFDERYYLAKHPEVRLGELSGLEHYLRHGWRKGADPAPWFSSDGYVQINKDVAGSELPPFVHYVLYGRAEGRTIAPTPDAAGRGTTPAPAAPAAPTASPDLLALRNRESMIGTADIVAYTERRLARL